MKLYLEWQARAVRDNGHSKWFHAEVPGNVQYDYGRMMGCGDISVGDNVTKFRKTEDYTWEYRTWLSFEEIEGENNRGMKMFFIQTELLLVQLVQLVN